MSTPEGQPFLPPEIIVKIIESLIPPSDLSPIAFPPSHQITVTLLSLARTCRATYAPALRLLYNHCLYIDSPHRLHRLVASLSSLSTRTTENPLSPIHHRPTSLYLSPFPASTIADLPIANALHSLLTLLAPTLRHLVIDIPLRSLYPSDDTLAIRPVLRHTFAQLVSLELFCSVRDELFLDCYERSHSQNVGEPPVWSLWPKLKTLVLYNADVSAAEFWPALGRLREMETLVLTRSDGLEEVDVKMEWLGCCCKEQQERGLSVVLVNVASEHRVPRGREGWREDDAVSVRELNVPISDDGDEDYIELCQEWMKRSVLSGFAVAGGIRSSKEDVVAEGQDRCY